MCVQECECVRKRERERFVALLLHAFNRELIDCKKKYNLLHF